MIIGLVGFIGSGKSTAANRLVNFHNFQEASFGSTLKDTVSVLFDWPRHLLEGDSTESRAWRDQIDEFWTRELNWKDGLTPRKALQYFATEVVRNNLHHDFWVKRLKKSLTGISGNIVVSDCRFANEIQMIKSLGGEIWQIQRDEDPLWVIHARNYLKKTPYPSLNEIKYLEKEFKTHSSEWLWLGTDPDRVIVNKDIHEFLYAIDDVIKTLL